MANSRCHIPLCSALTALVSPINQFGPCICNIVLDPDREEAGVQRRHCGCSSPDKPHNDGTGVGGPTWPDEKRQSVRYMASRRLRWARCLTAMRSALHSRSKISSRDCNDVAKVVHRHSLDAYSHSHARINACLVAVALSLALHAWCPVERLACLTSDRAVHWRRSSRRNNLMRFITDCSQRRRRPTGLAQSARAGLG
jgi:hypothetical protein